MKSDRDKTSVLDQISNLKTCNNKIRENLNAIQLIMVDNNYSRIKDPSVSDDLAQLMKQADSMSDSIDNMEQKLQM